MRRTALRWAAGLLAAGLIATPGVAWGDTPSTGTSNLIASTGGMSIDLLGTGVVTTVSLDATGAITSVDVGSTDFTQQPGDNPSKVKFTNTDGTTTVSVRAKGSKLQATVKTTSADQILGDHTWSSTVLGYPATVKFNVALDGSGNPLVNVTDIATDPAITVTGPDYSSDDHDDDPTSKATITFSDANGYTMRLTIKASLDNESDDHDDDHMSTDPEQPEYKLSVTLSGRDVQRLTGTLAELMGQHTWTSLSCAGVQAAVTYTVNADGTVTVDGVTLDGASTDAFNVKNENTNYWVQIDGLGQVKIKVWETDSGWKLSAKGNLKKDCSDDHRKDDHEGDHGKGHDEDGGHHNGGSEHGDD